MDIEIYPLDKVVIDGVSVCLGMEKTIVESIIGKGNLIGERYFYYNGDMAIDYNAKNEIEFIEFLGGIDGLLHPTIYGISVFDFPADEIKDILKSKNDDEIEDIENGYACLFSNISVGVYREVTPCAVEQLIKEMKENGISPEGNEDIMQEMRKANHWATIGIGVKGYYQTFQYTLMCASTQRMILNG